MKPGKQITTMVRGRCLALAGILVATLAVAASAKAQYKPMGDDGIAASPKVRAMLDERRAKTATVLATVPAMMCPKCTDIWVARPDTISKGSGARALIGQTTTLVARHLCEGCGTEWNTAGTGKAKQAVATHTCTGCGAENLACCAPKGAGGVATKGMEKEFQVAPVK